jgi:hypothetical protein
MSETVMRKVKEYLVIDMSGNDDDTLEVRGLDGAPGTALLGKAPYGLLAVQWQDGTRKLTDFSEVTLPDGTSFDGGDVQFAFQTRHIEVYGACVIDVGYLGIPT